MFGLRLKYVKIPAKFQPSACVLNTERKYCIRNLRCWSNFVRQSRFGKPASAKLHVAKFEVLAVCLPIKNWSIRSERATMMHSGQFDQPALQNLRLNSAFEMQYLNPAHQDAPELLCVPKCRRCLSPHHPRFRRSSANSNATPRLHFRPSTGQRSGHKWRNWTRRQSRLG